MMKTKKEKNNISKNHYGYYFIAPFFIGYFIFGLIPAVYTLLLAFFQYDNLVGQTTNFVGFEYIFRALTDPVVWSSLLNSIQFWIMGTIIGLSTSLLIAAVFSYVNIKGKQFFKTTFFIPCLVSTAAISTLVSLFISCPSGVLNTFLLNMGWIEEPVLWASNATFMVIIIVLMGWWLGFGSSAITSTAAMSSIDTEIYESARMDGAGFFKTFFKITIPLIKPILIYMVITGLIFGLQAFDLQFMMGGGSMGGSDGSLRTISMYIYQQAFEVGNIGYAAAISLVFFVIIFIFSLIALRLLTRGDKNAI